LARRGAHFGVAGQFGAGEMPELALAGSLHSLAYDFRVFDPASANKFLVVDAVEEGAVKVGR